jgi:hypothetical protein
MEVPEPRTVKRSVSAMPLFYLASISHL